MKKYEELEMEIVAFGNEDVILTSSEDETEDTNQPIVLPFVPIERT